MRSGNPEQSRRSSHTNSCFFSVHTEKADDVERGRDGNDVGSEKIKNRMQKKKKKVQRVFAERDGV